MFDILVFDITRIVKAKEKAGKYAGRKASVDAAAVKELHQSGLGVSAIAKQLNIGRSSVYRSLEG